MGELDREPAERWYGLTIALVVPGPLDRRSGGYSYDLDLVAALRNLGHAVDVWSLPERGASSALKRRLGELPEVVLFDALVHAKVTRLLSGWRGPKGLWIALVHHLAWLEVGPGAQTAGLKRRERRFLAAMDAFWFNSDDTRRSVVDLRGPSAPAKPFVVCRPPLPAPRGFVPAPSNQGRLLFLGNLVPRKNLHALLEALARLTDRRPDLGWSLTVAGSEAFGPHYARTCRQLAARSRIDDRIRWEGRVSDERREQLWAESDLLALPSAHEGWGMAHAEALVRGLPALAVPTGGVLEVLGDAALWSKAEPDALASALERYLDEDEFRADLARRARHRAPALRTRTGFADAAGFFDDLLRWRYPAPASAFDFGAYLEAKASVDERSLHPRVADAIWTTPPTSVCELGGGTGTMARRLLAQGRLPPTTPYLLVDQDEGSLALARERTAPLFAPGAFQTRQADLLAFWEEDSAAPDLVIAHALLDLFDPDAAAPALARMGARRYWLTHLFDGLTAWEPELPGLDEPLAVAYHRSMLERAPGGANGSPRSGRDWLSALPAAGLRILAIGASDWVVRPENGRYPADEAHFLGSMLHFFRTSLTGRTDVDAAALAWWLARREGQLARGELSLVVHQLDVAAERVSPPGTRGEASP